MVKKMFLYITKQKFAKNKSTIKFVLSLIILSIIFVSDSFAQTTIWSTDFETGNSVPTYSLTTGLSLGLSTVGGNNAAYCGKIVANSGGAGKVYDGSIITNNALTFTAGKYYIVEVYAKYATAEGMLRIMKSATNTNASMKAATGSNIIMDASTLNVVSTSYVKYRVGFTVSTTENNMFVGFQMIQTATASANMFLDDISIIEYNTPQCEHYCKPNSNNLSTAGYISNVTFPASGGINRTSTWDNYICTGLSATVTQGLPYSLSISKTIANPASINAWIDYNGNGVFYGCR
jgi:predicted small secreted protein